MKLALASPRGCICTFKIKEAKTYGGPCIKVKRFERMYSKQHIHSDLFCQI